MGANTLPVPYFRNWEGGTRDVVCPACERRQCVCCCRQDAVFDCDTCIVRQTTPQHADAATQPYKAQLHSRRSVVDLFTTYTLHSKSTAGCTSPRELVQPATTRSKCRTADDDKYTRHRSIVDFGCEQLLKLGAGFFGESRKFSYRPLQTEKLGGGTHGTSSDIARIKRFCRPTPNTFCS